MSAVIYRKYIPLKFQNISISRNEISIVAIQIKKHQKERKEKMKGLKKKLLEEQQRLENVIGTAKEQLQSAPEGMLRLSKTKKYPQYYHCTEVNRKKSKNGRYLRKNEMELVRQLAQKEYDEKVLRLAQKRLVQIEKLVKDYSDEEIEEIYLKEHPERKKFICPIAQPWEEKLQRWMSEEYVGKEFYDDTPIILTDRGEKVRSKSEKILADYFYRNGIFYKYEHPLYLRGYKVVYPDFTFLSPKTGEEIYWEHHGKVDDPNYARNMVKKILAYESNEIYPGENLILTFETEQTVLNTKTIERMVERYLLP